MNEMKTSIAPSSSEGRAQRRNQFLSNSKEESSEINIIVSGSRDAEKLGRKSQIEQMRCKQFSERGNIFSYTKVYRQ